MHNFHMNRKNLKQVVADLKSKTGWSDMRLASEMGVNQTTISRIQKGVVAGSIRTLYKALELESRLSRKHKKGVK